MCQHELVCDKLNDIYPTLKETRGKIPVMFPPQITTNKLQITALLRRIHNPHYVSVTATRHDITQANRSYKSYRNTTAVTIPAVSMGGLSTVKSSLSIVGRE